MARKKKLPPKGASNAYLLSFGDTMTTLLAFFIVLNSLADEQTGANLYQGTGSFIQSMQNFGISGGVHDKHARAVPLSEVNPMYVVPSEDGETDPQALGPDDENSGRILDREREDFERFIDELAKLSEIDEQAPVRGEAAFDYFQKLADKPPRLNDKYKQVLAQIVPLLYSQQHDVELIVWATTPAPSAWERAGALAGEIGKEIVAIGKLQEEQRARLHVTAKPWISSTEKRPVLTIVTRKHGLAIP